MVCSKLAYFLAYNFFFDNSQIFCKKQNKNKTEIQNFLILFHINIYDPYISHRVYGSNLSSFTTVST